MQGRFTNRPQLGGNKMLKQAMVEVAYDLLSKKQGPQKFNRFWNEVCDAIQNIEDNGRIPMLQKYRNKGYKEIVWRRKGSKSDWYFEYKVELDENNEYYIHVYEVINHRNMYESNIEYAYKNKLYESIMRDIAKIVKKAIIEQD